MLLKTKIFVSMAINTTVIIVIIIKFYGSMLSGKVRPVVTSLTTLTADRGRIEGQTSVNLF